MPSNLHELTDDYYWDEDVPTTDGNPSYKQLMIGGACILVLFLIVITLVL